MDTLRNALITKHNMAINELEVKYMNHIHELLQQKALIHSRMQRQFYHMIASLALLEKSMHINPAQLIQPKIEKQIVKTEPNPNSQHDSSESDDETYSDSSDSSESDDEYSHSPHSYAYEAGPQANTIKINYNGNNSAQQQSTDNNNSINNIPNVPFVILPINKNNNHDNLNIVNSINRQRQRQKLSQQTSI